ncbi:hypothetical protein [Pseudomonas sp. A-B-19]
MSLISTGLDEHGSLTGEVGDVHVPHGPIETFQELQLQAPPRLPST